MDNKTILLRRLIVLFGVLMLLCALATAGLYSLQIINGEQYRQKAERRLTSTSVISAARGEILDRYGRPLVTNRSVYSIRFDYAYWDHANQNDILLQLYQLIVSNGLTIERELPITMEEPFTFTGEADDKARQTLIDYLEDNSKIGIKNPETAEAGEIIEALRAYYGVSENYAVGNMRAIVELRYQMDIAQFSRFNPFILIEDIPMSLIAQIEERQETFAGVRIETTTTREYQTDYAAHVLGRTGPIYKEDWSDYKDQGYSMDAIVGKSGLEFALEEYLRGRNGSRLVETDVTGEVTGAVESAAPQPGNNCILTIDIELQRVAEESLARTISSIAGAEGGAAVVMDVNNGEVLALANYPTYSQATFNQDYDENYNNPLKPMLNRALSGTYQPGSTFKPLVAVAGLTEGVVNPSSTVTCNHYYTRFSSRTFKCTGWHGVVDVRRGIQKSCNIYFYETAYLLGGAKLEEWQHKFGLGETTGIELAEGAGMASGPDNRADMLARMPYLNPWQPGDVVQTGIGQSDVLVTPIQLCNYIATIANGGTRYQPTLLKNVKSYDYSRTVKEEQPTVVENLNLDPEVVALVRESMTAVAEEGGTAARTFQNYPIQIAAKTGTAQHSKTELGNETDHGVFVAFAPADDPQIAVAIVGECAAHGSDLAPIARDIFDAYFAGTEEAATVPKENTLQP